MSLYNSPYVQESGMFQPGTSAVFFLSFPDINGDLVDPSSLTARVYDPNGSLLETSTDFEKLAEEGPGHYAFSYDIETDAAIGLYRLEVEFTTESLEGTTTKTYQENFVVTQTNNLIFDQRVLGSRAFLESFLGYAQRIPVFNETGRLNKAKNVAQLTFPRWNQPSGVRVYLNGKLTDFDYTVDYMRGRIEFTRSLSRFDHVTVDYTFRWFKDSELDEFIEQAINIFNQYPPVGGYNIINIPVYYITTPIMQAAVFCLRRLMMDIIFQEPAKVFGGPERADAILGKLETLKQNYEAELKSLYENKKYAPYVGLTMTVSSPTFTLPGGRSRWFRYLFKGG